MRDRRYTISETSDYLNGIRMRVYHGVFRKEDIGQHYYMRFFFQFHIHSIKKTACKEIVFLHPVCFPLLVSIFKFVFFQFVYTLGSTEHRRALQ